MDKIKVVSRLVQIMLVLYALVHISLWALSVVEQPTLGSTNQPDTNGVYITTNFKGMESEAAQLTAIGMNPRLWLNTPGALFQLAIFSFLFLLFQQYRLGSIYSLEAVTQIRRIGYCTIIWPLFEVLYGPGLIIGLKLSGVIEHGDLTFSFNNDGLEMLAIGLIITVVSWIIAEGRHMKEEQDLTI